MGEEGLEGGIRQHPTFPREQPGPVTCAGAEGRERVAQTGPAPENSRGDRRCRAEEPGHRPARGGRAGAHCRERRLAASVWAGPAATAVAHLGSLGRRGWGAKGFGTFW